MEPSFSRFTSTAADQLQTAELIECYRQVFADAPWNEWLLCPVCGRYWGRQALSELTAMDFSHCGQLLVDYWSPRQVALDLRHEITDETSCWLASAGSKVIGFCWGYEISLPELEQKLDLEITSSLIERFGAARIGYQDEVGVINEWRRQGIGKQLVRRRLEDFLARGLDVGIVRTRALPEPSVTYAWYLQLGYQVIKRYPAADGRVILAGNLSVTRQSL